MRAFREAVEYGDQDKLFALLDDDVVFRSPAVFTPYRGKPATSVILEAVNHVFENFRYTRTVDDPSNGYSILIFEANVGDVQLEGADFVQTNGDGLITDLRVMIRPLKGLAAVVDAMGKAIPVAMAKLGVTGEQMKSA